MRTVVRNTKIVTSTQVLENHVLAFQNGKIEYIGTEEIQGDKVVDGQGNYLIPGFVDLHCHGCKGMAFMGANEEEFSEIADFHLSHGTTTMLATTSTSSMEETETTLQTFSTYTQKNSNSILRGMHMEGPWLNAAQCGAQAVKFMRTPSGEELQSLKEKYPFILRAGAAPELDGGMEFGRKGRELGVVMAVAHSDATFTEIECALQNGYVLMTHLYSGMKGMERKNAYRIAGAIEAGLYFDDMYAEIIADGKHLPLELLRFIYKCKGADRLCLVTDATRACGLPNGSTTIGISSADNNPIIVEDDVAKLLDRQSFAGSTATTDRLYRTMAKAIGKDMVALSKMASLTPARLMGWKDVGELAVGKKADMLLLDENLNIQKVITNKEN